MKKILISLFLAILLVSCNDVKSTIQSNNIQETEAPLKIASNSQMQINSFHPIIVSNILIGGSKNFQWIDEVDRQINGNETYKVYNLNGFISDGIGSKVEETNSTKIVNVSLDKKLPDDYFAINCDWNAMPRVITVQNNDNSEYKTVVEHILKENNLKEISSSIKQTFRVDLDIDGKEEVLITAGNMDDLSATAKKGTYSFVLLRKTVGTSVKDILIEKKFFSVDGDYSEGNPFDYEVIGIADLNGDNKMEIIIKYKYFEGYGYKIYELNNDTLELVLSGGLGA